MTTALSIAIPFLFGLFVLLGSAELLIRSVHALAVRFKLPPIVLALTVVAIGTSLPELVVSITSILHHDEGLAIGNIVGSNITNATFILGLSILTSNLRIGTHKTQKHAWILIAVTMLFLAIQLLSLPPIINGTILLVGCVSVLAYQFVLSKEKREKKDPSLLKLMKKMERYKKRHPLISMVFIAASIVGLIAGGSLMTTSTESLAVTLNVTTLALGLTLTAFSTSLPELITTLLAEAEHEDKIALGNVLGSNIYNLLLIGGIIALFPQARTLVSKDIFFFIASTFYILFVIVRWKGQHVPRWVGLIGIAIFAAFLFTTIKTAGI